MFDFLVVLAQAAPEAAPVVAPTGGWWDWLTANWAIITTILLTLVGILKGRGWIKGAAAAETLITAMNKVKAEKPEVWNAVGAEIKKQATADSRAVLLSTVVKEVTERVAKKDAAPTS